MTNLSPSPLPETKTWTTETDAAVLAWATTEGDPLSENDPDFRADDRLIMFAREIVRLREENERREAGWQALAAERDDANARAELANNTLKLVSASLSAKDEEIGKVREVGALLSCPVNSAVVSSVDPRSEGSPSAVSPKRER